MNWITKGTQMKTTTAIENFLSSMDMSLSMVDHFRNAMRDALTYKWDSDTVVSIMASIEDAYNKKGK